MDDDKYSLPRTNQGVFSVRAFTDPNLLGTASGATSKKRALFTCWKIQTHISHMAEYPSE